MQRVCKFGHRKKNKWSAPDSWLRYVTCPLLVTFVACHPFLLLSLPAVAVQQSGNVTKYNVLKKKKKKNTEN